MEIKNLFEMAKADKYTADGRAEIADARKTYQVGEISQATGLQKTANGWVKAKQGAGKSSAGTGESAEAHKKAAIAAMTPEQKKAVMEGKTYRYANKNGVSDITKEDLEASAPAESKQGAGIPKADEKTFVGKTYKDFAEAARASGYTPKADKENPDGSSSTTFENKEGKSLRVDFDKNGKIQKVENQEASSKSSIDTAHDSAPLTGDTKIRVKK